MFSAPVFVIISLLADFAGGGKPSKTIASPSRMKKVAPDGVKDIFTESTTSATKGKPAPITPQPIKKTTAFAIAKKVAPDGVKDIFTESTTVAPKSKPAPTTPQPIKKTTAFAIIKKVAPDGVKDIFTESTTSATKGKPAPTTPQQPATTEGQFEVNQFRDGVNNIYTESTAEPVQVADMQSPNPPTPSANAMKMAASFESTTQPSLTSTLQMVPSQTTHKAAITIDRLKELYNVLLTGYDSRIRPILDQTRPVRVVTTFIPLNVITFDTREQNLRVRGYFIIQWMDQLLKWNPAEYAESSKIFIPIEDIWTPHLIIAKAHDGNNIIGDNTDVAMIRSNGVAKWVPESIYSVVCEVDIQFYPYDVQTCSLTYYLSDETLPSVKLNYVGEPSLEEYIENAEWELLEHSVETRTHMDNNYIDLKFKLARRGEFAMFTVIAPLLMLSVLNGMVFLVPIDTGEKASFSITIFLSYGIFVTLIIDTLPHNSLNVSYFLMYIISLLMLSVILVFYTVIQSKIFVKCGKKPCSLPNLIPKFCTRGISSVRTWAMFMKQLDTYLFYVFFVIIAADTALFLTTIMNKIHMF